ncbi:MAG: Ig-like domain-containing protein, partial [Pirellulales bacterium]
GLTALASNSGAFEFPNVPLTPGENALTAQASDAAGNTATFPLTVDYTPPTGNQTDPVIAWNQTALDAIRQDATDPNMASRGLAMVQSAVLDALNAAEQKPGHFVTIAAPADSSAPAAVDQAAHDVLAYLYPGQQATFDAELAATLSDVPDGQAKTDGIAAGQQAAAAIIAMRANDGWNNYVDYTPGSGPGVWVPTPPNYAQALEPQWATLTPWTMTSDSQFRPAGPPDLTSQAWADALNQVQSLGAANSTTRTADQTQIAHFWADTNGTSTPPGHWNEIADAVAQSEGNSLDADAQLFAELDVGLADAAIVAWDAKYAYNAWRPVTAIPNAASSGNPNVTADANWQPMLLTPNFPEYVSGHSTFSGTAAGILDAVFGANTSFTAASDFLPGVTRSYTSFDQAAEEAGMSRIYAGIHFMFSNTDGLAAGHSLADYVLSTFDTTHDTVPPKVSITSPLQNSAANHELTVTGQVTDNLSGVQSLTAAIDDGSPAPVTFDASGNFTFTTSLPLDGSADGPHLLHFQSADFAGNISVPADLGFTLETKPPAIALTSPMDGDAIDVSAQLTGSVTSASSIVSLNYNFDGGTAMPFTTAADGSFTLPLDLSRLSPGDHTLTVTATSAAGNTTHDSITVHLAALIPLTISSMLPVAGAGDVGVTYRPRIDFSRAIDTSTLTSADFYATDSTGAVVPSTIVPSQDGTFAWLFFTSDLPGASTVTITVDGSQIKDAAGNLLDADDSGMPGSVLMSSFTTVNVAGQPDTTVYTSLDQTQPTVNTGASLTGIVADPGPDLQPGTKDDVAAGPDGVLMTADDVYKLPIAGVKVYIIGHEDQAVFTDANGRFTFNNVPTGDVKLV